MIYKIVSNKCAFSWLLNIELKAIVNIVHKPKYKATVFFETSVQKITRCRLQAMSYVIA
jgi:hypothetical protein